MENLGGAVAILGGIFCICGSVLNWNFFFNNYKARRIVNVFGRDGARIFYTLVGVFCIIAGIATIIQGS